MRDGQQLEEIRAEARRVADIYADSYGKPMRWRDWGANSQEDFWSQAQDNLDIPQADKIPLPDDEIDRD